MRQSDRLDSIQLDLLYNQKQIDVFWGFHRIWFRLSIHCETKICIPSSYVLFLGAITVLKGRACTNR